MYTRKNFRILVQRALQEYYAKTNPKLSLPLPAKEEPKRFEVDAFSPDSKSADKIKFTYFEYTDADVKQAKQKSTFRAYYHEDAGKQICIVEQRPWRVANEKFEKEFEAALSTLDLSAEATVKRGQYKKLMK